MPLKPSVTKWECLTDRERELLNHLVKGASNKIMADSLCISPKTVEFHITNILKKLELNSRVEVLVWMFEHYPDARDTIKD